MTTLEKFLAEIDCKTTKHKFLMVVAKQNGNARLSHLFLESHLIDILDKVYNENQ